MKIVDMISRIIDASDGSLSSTDFSLLHCCALLELSEQKALDSTDEKILCSFNRQLKIVQVADTDSNTLYNYLEKFNTNSMKTIERFMAVSNIDISIENTIWFVILHEVGHLHHLREHPYDFYSSEMMLYLYRDWLARTEDIDKPYVVAQMQAALLFGEDFAKTFCQDNKREYIMCILYRCIGAEKYADNYAYRHIGRYLCK